MRKKSAALVLAILVALTGFGSVNIYADDGSDVPAGNDAVVLTQDMAAGEETAADEAVAEEEAAEETTVEEATAEEAAEEATAPEEETAEEEAAASEQPEEAVQAEQPAAPEKTVADVSSKKTVKSTTAKKKTTAEEQKDQTDPEDSEEPEQLSGWQDDMYYTTAAKNGSYYTEADGPVLISGTKYCFDEDGHLLKTAGVVTFGSNKYYVTSKGTVVTGRWVYKNNKKVYYARTSGALYVNTKVKINGNTRIFGKDGKLVKGVKLVTFRGSKYYVNGGGVVKTTVGVVRVGDKKYFVYKGGKVRTKSGIVSYTTSKGKKAKYYIKKNGTVRTTRGIQTFTSNGTKHRYFVREGGSIKLTSGFVKVNGNKYYVRNNGTGWLLTSTKKTIGGSKYIFSSTGKVRRGIIKYDGDYYYAYKGTGKVRTKTGMYKTQSGATVYVGSSSGKLLTSEIVSVGGAKYIFKANARRAKGVVKLDGKYYYCSPKNNCAVRTEEGKFKYKDKWYYAKSSGVLYRDEFIVNGEVIYHASKKAYLNTKAFTSEATSGDRIMLHPNANTARISYSEYAGLFPYPKAPDSDDPCVLVDISDQTLYYYENGRLKFKTPVVTGRIYGGQYHGTPTGTHHIQFKQRNVILKGLEDDGKTKYESHVDYWMPFIGNSYGLHDATWRGSFGGTIYQYSGSHGCVNMPYSYAQRLYNGIRTGDIVKVQQ